MEKVKGRFLLNVLLLLFRHRSYRRVLSTWAWKHFQLIFLHVFIIEFSEVGFYIIDLYPLFLLKVNHHNQD
jgi:hypothetical protein